MVTIERNILDKNQAFADSNRLHFQQNGVLAINLLSSPGAGKTSLLVQTIENLKENVPIFVIEGDQETENDAQRIRATGSQAVQINTGKGCHLDAHMVGHALESLQFSSDSLLMIENVGNLVCPASFDLGESYKVVILSVTEGEDKPIKYPDMFAASDLMIVNKIDLLPYLKFDVDKAIEYARRVNPSIEIIQLSVETGQGMKLWTQWLLSHMQSAPVDFLRDSETTESASHA
ncbi:MAG: hydrogenase nickel incorporation protein HypB [Acidiferrobacterales bacterium]|nr:hydrogenase nickel incorporation protein HypB [Acidiferrobacterales bacterium]